MTNESSILSCVIIDDEPHALNLLRGYIGHIPFLSLKEEFTNPIKALAYIETNDVDVVFLDINMPLLSGIQLLNNLKKSPQCILTSAYSEYALESYDLNVVDYLLKPIEFERFLKAVNKLLKKSEQSKTDIPVEYTFVKTGHETRRINWSEILYIKSDGNYISIYTIEDRVMTLMTMNEMLDKLPSSLFQQSHRSYIVNIQRIDVLKNDMVLIGENEIPISRSFKSQLKEVLRNKS